MLDTEMKLDEKRLRGFLLPIEESGMCTTLTYVQMHKKKKICKAEREGKITSTDFYICTGKSKLASIESLGIERK